MNPSRIPDYDIGHKAAALFRMEREGLPVPIFEVIPASSWIKSLDAEPSILERIRHLNLAIAAARDDIYRSTAASTLRKMLHEMAIPHTISLAINNWIHRLPSYNVTCVRSSALSEDSEFGSAAGQYISSFCQTSFQSISAATIKTIVSYYGERAINYRRLRKQFSSEFSMSVILQKAIHGEISGCILGADPREPNTNLVTIEFVRGMACSLMDGQITPERYILDKNTGNVVKHEPGYQNWEWHLTERGNLRRYKTNPANCNFTNIDVINAYEIYCKIEDTFGCIQDVEWVKNRDKIWVVQSRSAKAQLLKFSTK